jgi:uncharacterized protein with FMN-binding domain
MKRVALAIVSTIAGLVMLLSFKSHALGVTASPPAAVSPTTAGAGSSNSGGAGNSSGGTTASKSAGSASSASKAANRAATYTGRAVNTVYGPVEVKITVKDGKVTAATAVEYPNQDPRDAQINYYAIPILNHEAAQASSANISHVSGATYTSGGYIASLQSALNKAGI